MKIAIVIPTYYRADGSTLKCLQRAIESVKNQDAKGVEWKIFLMGDRYEKPIEIIDHILPMVPASQIVFHNLKKAAERDNNYPKELLWKYGGVNALNTGIRTALHEGFDWIAHLDHDDYWSPTHLYWIADAIKSKPNAAFVCTVSKYLHEGSFLPVILSHELFAFYYPEPQRLIHSSVCINHAKIPLFYIDRYAEVNYKEIKSDWLPADADMWKRITEFMQNHTHLGSYCVQKLTCYHMEEGFELNK